MVTDIQIRDRFCSCLDEVRETFKEKAIKLQVDRSYLISLKTKPNPQIKGSLIANFCIIYHYSPLYILSGEGSKKGNPDEGEIIRLFKTLLREIKNRNKDSAIIHDLLSGMLELNVQFGGVKDKLINQAKKHIKS